MNKKFLALLLAATISFAAAGCIHKDTPQSGTEEAASVQEDSTAPSKENITTRPHNYTYETVIVTDKEGNTHKVAVTQPKVTQYTTRAPSPSRLTTRPTAAPTTVVTRPATTARTTRPVVTTKPVTTGSAATTNPVATTKPVTTSAPFKAPKVEYGGTLTMGGSSVRITSHTASLSQNNSVILLLDIEIISADSKANAMYIGYDCYDSSGKKINAETVMCVVSLAPGSTSTKAIATAPINTAKVVFKSI